MRMIRLFFYISIFCFLLSGTIHGQTTKEEVLSNNDFAGGVYCGYRYSNNGVTHAPKGYRAFYISHYGRHGSRWLTSSHYYEDPLSILEKAHSESNLTFKGERLYSQVKIIFWDAEGRYGALTRKGTEEQKGIAERMYHSFPEVFSTRGNRECNIYSRSTTVPRCIMSMAAFNERLKELNPDIVMDSEAVGRNLYLNNHIANPTVTQDSLDDMYEKFFNEHFDAKRFLETIFISDIASQKYVTNPFRFIFDLYSMAGDVQDTDLKLSLWDIFTNDEIFVLWQTGNLRMYYICGPSAINGEASRNSAKLLLRNIIGCADEAIKSGNISADLRFGHDVYTIPLLALMDIDGMNTVESDPEKVYQVWSDFKVSPMGVNLQLIFYKTRKSDDVLIKILHCEKEVNIPVKTDCAPYYHWKDVKTYYEQKLADIN